MASIKRETAVICSINTLLDGEFVRTEGWKPSYFSTNIGDVSRTNLMGVIVSKEPTGNLYLDDGTGRILLRSFEEQAFEDLNIGDFVMVVGRPRVYNEERYVLPEIISKPGPRWGEYRKLQLKMRKANTRARSPEQKDKKIKLDPPVQKTNYYQKILEFIKDLDNGGGADIEEVKKRSGAPDAEGVVKKLIEEGEVFELRPGKLKIL